MADDIGAARRAAPEGRALDMAGLDQALGFRLRLAQQFVFREFAAHFAPLELSPVLYSALLLIEANPGCRQTDLAAALGVRQPNLVERIDSLVQRGLVSRSPDPDDRRANVLKLTPAGQRFMVRAHAVHDRHTRQLIERVGEENHDKLVEILERLY